MGQQKFVVDKEDESLVLIARQNIMMLSHVIISSRIDRQRTQRVRRARVFLCARELVRHCKRFSHLLPLTESSIRTKGQAPARMRPTVRENQLVRAAGAARISRSRLG